MNHNLFVTLHSQTQTMPKEVTLRALMAELVDALVSNTNGASRAGSSPAQGTKVEKKNLLDLCFNSIC